MTPKINHGTTSSKNLSTLIEILQNAAGTQANRQSQLKMLMSIDPRLDVYVKRLDLVQKND